MGWCPWLSGSDGSGCAPCLAELCSVLLAALPEGEEGAAAGAALTGRAGGGAALAPEDAPFQLPESEGWKAENGVDGGNHMSKPLPFVMPLVRGEGQPVGPETQSWQRPAVGADCVWNAGSGMPFPATNLHFAFWYSTCSIASIHLRPVPIQVREE